MPGYKADAPGYGHGKNSVSAGIRGACLPGLGITAERRAVGISPLRGCAVLGGGLKANKNRSVGGQTPAFCSSPGCDEPLPGSVSSRKTGLRAEAVRWEGDGWIIPDPLISPAALGCSRSQLFKAAIIPSLGLVLHLITAEQIRSFIYRSRRKTGGEKSLKHS